MSKIQDFITLLLSIVIESLPFVVIGVLFSVLIALFVSETFVIKLMPKNRFVSHFVICCFGLFAPVCQCGNIPVARRFIMQGFSISQSVTFLLAAPIVNPITFLTTWEAFRLNHAVAFIRIGAGFFIAYIIGIFISYQRNQKKILTKQFNVTCHLDEKRKPSFVYALHVFQSEFMLIMKMLCLGAAVAAFIQVFVPKATILAIGHSIYLSVLAMLLLGFVISLCSTVDAFFALSYINAFPLGSILTFLIFGPLVDIKMLFMMKTTFKARFLAAISVFVAIISSFIGIAMNSFKL